MDIYNTINGSLSYEVQKRIISIEINQCDPEYFPDYKTFEKDEKEKALAYNLKHQWRENMRAAHPNFTRRTAGKKQFLYMQEKYVF